MSAVTVDATDCHVYLCNKTKQEPECQGLGPSDAEGWSQHHVPAAQLSPVNPTLALPLSLC